MGWSDNFESLRVTAYLRTGIICDRWLPLDAILLYQASRDQCSEQMATLPGGETEKKNVTMPLAVIHPGESDWYYACSWAQPQPWWIAEGRDYWNKRLDQQFAYLVDFGGRRGKVMTAKGRYRSYHMPVFYRTALEITWYCVGDKERIECLLSTVTHIGKKRAQGWGAVARWKVTLYPEDYSIWRGKQLTRGVPIQDAKEEKILRLMHYGLRPSYYRSQNQMPLAMPE